MPIIALTSAIRLTRTTSIAPTFTASRSPSVVPRVMASITLLYCSASATSPPSVVSEEGIITRAIMIAPITLMAEAIRMCPSAPSITPPNTFAYRTMIEPATVDMPAVKHDEELGPRQVLQISANDQRRLDHAEEHARPSADTRRRRRRLACAAEATRRL